MRMHVCVWFPAEVRFPMLVSVVFVVDVRMLMCEHVVDVPVLVHLREEQAYTERHQTAGPALP